VWSPFANFWLYGATANITAAKAAGVRIALGSDWAPSGTATSLREFKVAERTPLKPPQLHLTPGRSLSQQRRFLRQPPPDIVCKFGNRLHRELCLDGPVRRL
jgi:hypothetical protein